LCCAVAATKSIQCPGPPSSCLCITRLLCITHPRATPGLLAPESRAKPVGGKVHHALLRLMSRSRSRSRSRSAIPCRTFPPFVKYRVTKIGLIGSESGDKKNPSFPVPSTSPPHFLKSHQEKCTRGRNATPSNTESPNWPHRFRVGNQEKSVMPCSIRG
jgi:hypothetical protein